MPPSRSGRSPTRRTAFAFALSLALAATLFAGPKGGKNKDANGRPIATPTPTPGDGLTNLPLPIGHEAKGLILPNFDAAGHLTGKLEAGAAKRIDVENVEFSGLKLTTFTEDDAIDLQIDMSTSVMNLKTRVISSKQRTTVRRTDLNIVGDSMQFDTVSHLGRLVGHVKMVITGKARLAEAEDETP